MTLATLSTALTARATNNAPNETDLLVARAVAQASTDLTAAALADTTETAARIAADAAEVIARNAAIAGIAITGLVGTNLAVVADRNVIGGIEVVHVVDVVNASSNTYAVVLTHKTEIVDVVVQKRGGAGGGSESCMVKNGNNPITDAMDLNVADKALVRAIAIDDVYSTIAAGGTMNVAVTQGSNGAMMVTVRGIRRT